MKELVLRCQQGDRAALSQLYTSMYDELLGVCRHFVADGEAAKDVLHDAFLLILGKISDVRSPEGARAWMHTVTKNVALLYLNEQHRMGQMAQVPLEAVVAMEADADAATAVGSADCAEPICDSDDAATRPAITYEEIMNAVDRLPEGYRNVFRLSVLEGLSHAEIASLLDIEPHSSSSQLVRAKRMLRQSLYALLFTLIAAIVYDFGVRNYELGVNDGASGNVEGAGPVPARNGSAGVSPASEGAGPVPARSGSAGVSPASAGSGPVPARSGLPAKKRSVEFPPDGSVDASPAIAVVKQVDTMKPTTTVEPIDSAGETPALPSADELSAPTFAGETPALPSANETPVLAGQREREGDEGTDGSAGVSPADGSCAAASRFSLAYSGLPSGSLRPLPYAATLDANPADSTSRHRIPLTVALDFSRRLTDRWTLDAGVSYTLLSSEMQAGNTFAYVEHRQRVRYLGLHLGTTCALLNHRRLSLYGRTTLGVELPLHSTLTSNYVSGGHLLDTETARLAPCTQWALATGLGLQYDLTPAIGLFAEPSLNYYLNTSGDVKTWRTEHPFSFSLPIGIRLTFPNTK